LIDTDINDARCSTPTLKDPYRKVDAGYIVRVLAAGVGALTLEQSINSFRKITSENEALFCLKKHVELDQSFVVLGNLLDNEPIPNNKPTVGVNDVASFFNVI
jgi:hypothetical protein